MKRSQSTSYVYVITNSIYDQWNLASALPPPWLTKLYTIFETLTLPSSTPTSVIPGPAKFSAVAFVNKPKDNYIFPIPLQPTKAKSSKKLHLPHSLHVHPRKLDAYGFQTHKTPYHSGLPLLCLGVDMLRPCDWNKGCHAVARSKPIFSARRCNIIWSKRVKVVDYNIFKDYIP